MLRTGHFKIASTAGGKLIAERGIPRYPRGRNCAEFVSRRLTQWLWEKGVDPVLIEPGTPWENGYLESFHGKLRDECLSEEMFWSHGEAQVVVDWYRDVYNSERQHSSLEYRTPAELAMGINTRRPGLALGLDSKMR